jgi:methanogenic corrinoid protein MtbC1
LIAELTLRHVETQPGAPSVVAACVPDELHELGLRMVCGALRQRGARVHYLGANVSPEFLVESVRQRQPGIVLLSASLENHLPSLQATLTALAGETFAHGQPVVVIGGAAVASPGDSPLPARVIQGSKRTLESTVEAILAIGNPSLNMQETT